MHLLLPVVVALSLGSQYPESRPKVGELMFCYSMAPGREVPAWSSHAMYRTGSRMMAELSPTRTWEEVYKILEREEVVTMLDGKTPVEVVGEDQDLTKVKVLEGKHKDKILRISASCNLYTVAGLEKRIKEDRDRAAAVEQVTAEFEAKRKAMKAALVVVEADAKKASEKASRANRQRVYEREMKKGWAKMAITFGYEKMSDPEKEMRKFMEGM